MGASHKFAFALSPLSLWERELDGGRRTNLLLLLVPSPSE